ncbi:glycosyltransferase [Flavimobilis sp. GY10621]|uniref:Glycosyltransferase n=1 Tax=Flavimobilis rhizosphaerae TaxID=2775421 RepID=A0ABR9DM09_9MICO|nr:glycosyltransferase [Flavimobilis rhizosphaerae]MBD9698163.1 glycosyltransferase [Flavimobilis rhizosphaerae]
MQRTLAAHLVEGRTSKFVSGIKSQGALKFAWSPLFDPRVDLRDWTEANCSYEGHPPLEEGAVCELHAYDAPSRVLALEESDLLPVDPKLGSIRITWGEARSRLLAAARETAVARPRNSRRVTEEWDEEAEQAWLASISDLPEPEGDGPLISVVMPVWNRPAQVVEAIRSVQAQSFSRWELVVVDDGSTDNTIEAVRAETLTDPRVRLIEAEHGGVCRARNHGLESVSTRYVAFLDSDNSWRPNYLETMVRAMLHQGLRAAYSALRVDGGVDEPSLYRAYVGGLEDLKSLNHIDLNVFVVETDLARQAGGFDPAIRRWNDHDFALRVADIVVPVLLPFIGCDYDHDEDGDRITTRESSNWQFAVLDKAWTGWDRVRETVADRTAGRTSVVIPTYNDSSMTLACVRSLVEHRSPEDDLEVVVVDNGSSLRIANDLRAALLPYPDVKVVRLPRNLNFATGSNYGFARSSGEFVLFLNNDTVVRPGWLRPLLEEIRKPAVAGVQPLLVYPDDLIQACGTVFPARDGLPVHLMQGHPKEDAARVAGLKFRAVTAAALLMRATDVARLKGFDALYANGQEDVDLCLRAADGQGSYFSVVPTSVVEHHESKTPGRGTHILENRKIFLKRWRGNLPGPEHDLYEAVGLRIDRYGSSSPPLAHPIPVVVRVRADESSDGTAAGSASLRWSVKNPANAGPRGDVWGDTHFIAALAGGLEKHGQEVVTYRHGTHGAPATSFDDVNLVIRGLDRGYAQPGKVNILWVISHPDDVTVDEVSEFDLVYAASHRWARDMSERSGREVKVLLQATDVSRFAFPDALPQIERDVIFVGQARRFEPRRVVMDAIEAGIDVAVWGPRWEMHLPERHVMGSYLPNEELAAAYASAGVVLNDHWEDMASEGFISNRLFDIVASGGRAVSDYVEGIDEVFGGSVRIYSSVEELRELCDPARLDEHFPDFESARKNAELMAERHSFDARAATLVGDVAEFIKGNAV